MFERTINLVNNQIINYRFDPDEKWLVLIGIALGSLEKQQLIKGNMQLFSIEQHHSQALETQAASFATCKVLWNDQSCALIGSATISFNARRIVSKLHVIELGSNSGEPGFTEKQADLFFPPDFTDGFPAAMQISLFYRSLLLLLAGSSSLCKSFMTLFLLHVTFCNIRFFFLFIKGLEEKIWNLHEERISAVLERRTTDNDEMIETQASIDDAMSVFTKNSSKKATVAAAILLREPN